MDNYIPTQARQERKHHDQLETIRLHKENKELKEIACDCRFKMACAIWIALAEWVIILSQFINN